jgi:hypothetical protein
LLTGPSGTKLGGNVHRMIPYKGYVFLLIRKKSMRPKGVEKSVAIYMVKNVYGPSITHKDEHFARKLH